RWYRTTFDLPAGEAAGWNLRFESVNREAEVFLNGRKLGEHQGAYIPFELSGGFIQPTGNQLLVKVDARLSKSDLPPGNRPRGWWNYGGILREVYLRRVRTLDLSELRVQATPGAPGKAVVTGSALNAGPAAQAPAAKVVISGPNGTVGTQDVTGPALAPGTRGDITASFDVPTPALWSPDTPALYTARVTLAGGQVSTTKFGFRTWSVSPDGEAMLNGRPLSLRGASFHEDFPRRGHALRPGDRARIVADLKALGADFTRAHYPPHPALLEAFDREGIVFWEQVPVWRMRGVDIGRLEGRALSTLEAAVMRDRNHASIMTWSAENETLKGGERERSYLEKAKEITTRLDGSRLFGVDTTLPLRSIPTFYDGLADVIGLNEYVGWYGGRLGQLDDTMSDVQARAPRAALFITEFGAEANRSGPQSQKGTYAFQRSFLARSIDFMDRQPKLGGVLVWALRDFPVRPGWDGGNPKPKPPVNFKGIVSYAGKRKPAFGVVRQKFAAVQSFKTP
nr:beta galactosidase jelly roll domain-containing protein [Thermoleophilaceae bacterium]